MGNICVCVARDHLLQGFVLHRAVRRRFRAGTTVACAGIVAIALVTPPPDSHRARTEVQSIHLTAFVPPPVAASGVIVGGFFSNQGQTVVDVPVKAVNAADIAAALETTPPTSPSAGQSSTLTRAIDTATPRQQIDNAVVAVDSPIAWVLALFSLFVFGSVIFNPLGIVVTLVDEAVLKPVQGVFRTLRSLGIPLLLPPTVAQINWQLRSLGLPQLLSVAM